MRKIIALTSSLALVLALAAHALHRGNAGPTDFEIKFHLPPPEPLSGGALVAFKSETRRALDKIREVEDVVFQLDDGSRVASTAKTGSRKKG